MHEVLSLSVGHRSNHLATQFFNCEEKKLYSQSAQENDFSVHLYPNHEKLNKTVSYTPRALLWEARAGFGSLGTYQYSQGEDYFYSTNNNNSEEGNVVWTSPKIPKSDYQAALDSGVGVPRLNSEAARYWSAYSRLIYSPSSFNMLRDWHHDVTKPDLPDFKGLNVHKFDTYEQGVQEFEENHLQEFFDGNFHTQLEQCDTLQGINMISSFDTAWGGFSSALLIELRNELPKTTVFAWNYYHRDVKINRAAIPSLESKIRGTIVCGEEADLVLPLAIKWSDSDWEQAGQTCRVLDTVNCVLSQRKGRQSMDYLKNSIAIGDQKRNFASSILEEQEHSYFADIPVFKNGHAEPYVFSECAITRGEGKETIKKNKINMNTFEFLPSDTIPDQYREPAQFSLKLASTEKCRDVFLYWRDLTYKYLRSALDGEEVIENLATMAAAYEHGLYDDEDSGDDL